MLYYVEWIIINTHQWNFEKDRTVFVRKEYVNVCHMASDFPCRYKLWRYGSSMAHYTHHGIRRTVILGKYPRICKAINVFIQQRSCCYVLLSVSSSCPLGLREIIKMYLHQIYIFSYCHNWKRSRLRNNHGCKTILRWLKTCNLISTVNY